MEVEVEVEVEVEEPPRLVRGSRDFETFFGTYRVRPKRKSESFADANGQCVLILSQGEDDDEDDDEEEEEGDGGEDGFAVTGSLEEEDSTAAAAAEARVAVASGEKLVLLQYR